MVKRYVAARQLEFVVVFCHDCRKYRFEAKPPFGRRAIVDGQWGLVYHNSCPDCSKLVYVDLKWLAD